MQDTEREPGRVDDLPCEGLDTDSPVSVDLQLYNTLLEVERSLIINESKIQLKKQDLAST